ncbi:hypothetical protein Micbo1qcDRAFT_210106 [Microdochium bolleyi]|uniref:BCS1 N-terminal domain-containing protein n=1 Tax=Microdochium bolleyi TaxID=196109 RepID=A0A136IKH7_9PEZI|nr:hypothetical protein Micbo1qcDRAFT_210106 [Microdochium bolleyi]
MSGLRSIPLFSIAEHWLGFDAGQMPFILGYAWTAYFVIKRLYDLVGLLVVKYFTTDVRISSNSEVYTPLMEWLAKSQMVSSRSFIVETMAKKDGEDRAMPIANLKHKFWWEGWQFTLRHTQHTSVHEGDYSGAGAVCETRVVVISCRSRTPKPLEDLVNHISSEYNAAQEAHTVIKWPKRPQYRAQGDQPWCTAKIGPKRAIETVFLDGAKKKEILDDINKYLHPKAPKWYGDRALAGVFGLILYTISLNDASLTENDLGTLFSKLPPRCIVLLEDIDTAGLRRSGDESDYSGRGMQNGFHRGGNSGKQGISLSSLLNAIDGVAAQEGRVLIITTNAPESLDEALIRPGRVDIQVKFANATRAQAQEQFVRMFKTNEEGPAPPASPAAEGNKRHNDLPGNKVEKDPLLSAAEEFASKVPEGHLSSAQIQEFLIQHRDDPTGASAGCKSLNGNGRGFNATVVATTVF